MRRGTTPTILVKINGIDPEELHSICFTLRQHSTELTMNSSSGSNGIYQFHLTQEQTLSFSEGSVRCQAKILMKDGSVVATPVKVVAMCEILCEEVVRR